MEIILHSRPILTTFFRGFATVKISSTEDSDRLIYGGFVTVQTELNIFLPREYVTVAGFWISCFGILAFLFPKSLKVFGFEPHDDGYSWNNEVYSRNVSCTKFDYRRFLLNINFQRVGTLNNPIAEDSDRQIYGGYILWQSRSTKS